jgi:hypothetical protein
MRCPYCGSHQHAFCDEGFYRAAWGNWRAAMLAGIIFLVLLVPLILWL